jgi:hypothetical protein
MGTITCRACEGVANARHHGGRPHIRCLDVWPAVRRHRVVVQAGFVIGFGILIDTFVVRTITVPAIAAPLGRASWWPARPWQQRSSEDPPKKTTVFDAVADESEL